MAPNSATLQALLDNYGAVVSRKLVLIIAWFNLLRRFLNGCRVPMATTKELGKRGITVNAVAPGPIETQLFMKGKEKGEIDKTIGLTPLGRLGQPEDIARAISFLVGPDGAWINGQILRANGGIV